VIRSFGNRETEQVWRGQVARRLPREMQPIARRKLRMLNNAADLRDLRIPPGNRLESLRGNLAGWHSIRVNDQWRVVFRFAEGDAFEVAIVDYH
jgi:proteic killer suppression protein